MMDVWFRNPIPPTRHCIEVPRVVDVIVGLRRRHAGAHGFDVDQRDVVMPGGGESAVVWCFGALLCDETSEAQGP